VTPRTTLGAARRAANAAALAPFSDTGEQPVVFAQGRNYDHVRLDDLPDTPGAVDAEGPLAQEERELLDLCERALREYEMSERVAAKALWNIRDRRLYRATHSTFDAYVREHHGKGRVWAHRVIEAAKVSEILLPAGNTLLPTKVTRVLGPVLRDEGPEVVREIHDEASKDGPATEVTTKAAREKRAAQSEGEPVQAEIVGETFDKARTLGRRLRNLIDEAVLDSYAAGRGKERSELLDDINYIAAALRHDPRR
jgi:hypothetical protein